MSIFETLNAINVNDKTETKNGLTYLSWAWAWGELLKRYPDSTYTIYENSEGWFYHTDGKTAWVKTGVTVEGKEYIEFLPVMDYKNRSIPLESITSFDVNKAIQRSLTKAVARHGLGLYIYAGEDLPDGESDAKKDKDGIPAHGSAEAAQEAGKNRLKEIEAQMKNARKNTDSVALTCERCGKPIKAIKFSDGNTLKADEIISTCRQDLGGTYCYKCYVELMEAKDGSH